MLLNSRTKKGTTLLFFEIDTFIKNKKQGKWETSICRKKVL